MDAATVSQRRRRRPALGVVLALGALVVGVAGGAGPGGPARAQEAATPVPVQVAVPGGGDYYAPPTTIFVNGQGRVKVQPDTASVTVGVDVLEDDLAEAQTAATEQANAIIAAVRAGGVADEDIQTANYSVTIVRDYDDQGNPGPITGYQVSNQVNLTVRDFDQDPDRLGAILDDVVAAGANNIYGIAFSVEDTAEAAGQARAQAMADAQRKAEQLAGAAGMTITRAAAITESFAPPPTPVDFGGADLEMARQAAPAGPVPVQAGTTEVVVDVQVTYEAR